MPHLFPGGLHATDPHFEKQGSSLQLKVPGLNHYWHPKMGIVRRHYSFIKSKLIDCFMEDIWEMFGLDKLSLSNIHTMFCITA